MFTGKYRLQGVEWSNHSSTQNLTGPWLWDHGGVGSLEKVLTAFPRALVEEEREGEEEVTRFITQLMFLFRTPS